MEKKAGFTLTEVMIVIAVIGILAGIVAPNAYIAIEKSKIARVEADTKNIRSAACAMYDDTGLWPGSNWVDDAANDPLAGADRGEGFVFKGNDPDMPVYWEGPYIEKWTRNPWGGYYWWDYNHSDQNGDGIDREHVLWIDNAKGNAGRRIRVRARIKIDAKLDDGNLDTGKVQVWQGNHTDGNLGYILVQGR